jgi:hypothetical protein
LISEARRENGLRTLSEVKDGEVKLSSSLPGGNLFKTPVFGHNYLNRKRFLAIVKGN